MPFLLAPSPPILHMTVQCVEDSGVFEYFRFWTSTNRNQTAPVFLGAGCTAATKPIATAARFWRTLQVPTSTLTDATNQSSCDLL